MFSIDFSRYWDSAGGSQLKHNIHCPVGIVAHLAYGVPKLSQFNFSSTITPKDVILWTLHVYLVSALLTGLELVWLLPLCVSRPTPSLFSKSA